MINNNENIISKDIALIDLIEAMEVNSNRIALLHKYSSDSFLAINGRLKGFYKTLELLKSNLNTIDFSLLVKSKNNQIAPLLDSVIQKLTPIYHDFERVIKDHQIDLELLQNKTRLIYSTVNNFRNDLASFQIIDEKKIRDNTTNNDFIENIESINIEFEQKAGLLKKQLKDIIRQLSYFSKNDIKLSHVNLSKLQLANDWIKTNLEQNSIADTTLFSQKLQKSYEIINQLIVELQFHDIIRQKLEHVREIYKHVHEDLYLLKHAEGEMLELFMQRVKTLPALNEIAQLHINHLNVIDTDFDTAINKIRTDLLDLWENMTAFQIHANKMIDYLAIIDDKFIEELAQLNRNDEWVKSRVPSAEFISNLIQELYENIESIVLYINNLAITQREVLLNFAAENSENNGNEFNDKLIELNNSLNFTTNKANDYFNLAFDKIKKIHNILNNYQPEYYDFSLSDLSEKGKRIYNWLKENIALSLEFANEANDSVSATKNKDVFAIVVKDIIKDLNKFKQISLNQALKSDKDRINDIIKNLENLYTMQNERDVHNRLFVTKTDDDYSNETDSLEDNDGLELF